MTSIPRPAPAQAASYDLDHYFRIPRVSGLILSPDGRRLVATVATATPDGKRFVNALWELDPDGERAPRRLTRSAPGESSPAFLSDGSVVFTSTRADPEATATEGDDEVPALWLLPPDGGEARMVAAAPGGITAVRGAREAAALAFVAKLFPGAETLEQDRERGRARDDAGVGAQLFESYPIRFWDHYLGPREPRLFAAAAPAAGDGRIDPPPSLTPHPGFALEEASFDLTPDGSTVVTTWELQDDVRNPRAQLVAVEVASGHRRVLFDDPGSTVTGVACSPDGRHVVCERVWRGTPESPTRVTLWLFDLAGGDGRDLLPGSQLRPEGAVWTPDGAAVLFHSDEQGHAPVFRVELHGGAVTRLSADGSFSNLCAAPDGNRLYALCDSVASPPEAVALATTGADQRAEPLPTPGMPLEPPCSLAEVRTTADDGTPLRAWLVLPTDASPSSPAPLVTFIHGGPVSSWSGWTWRWNAPLLAARGYAVLLPDPGLSTGYGQEFVGRGRGRWGGEPFTDLMALIDATEARPDIDETRTAAMGGSFGGYMANWLAGHTERFRCIVTHASIWSLVPFRGTTDSAAYWDHEFGTPEDDPERYGEHSPNRLAGAIRTPMLVIHGERDFRVPIGEALQLWTDLKFHGVEAKFLYFPDENHWILKPSNGRVWYETVLAFLDHHVLGKDWTRPSLL